MSWLPDRRRSRGTSWAHRRTRLAGRLTAGRAAYGVVEDLRGARGDECVAARVSDHPRVVSSLPRSGSGQPM